MSDICESCGCPEGVDGHDVLYRQIDQLKGVANVAKAIGTMDAGERSMLCKRITDLEEMLKRWVHAWEAAALQEAEPNMTRIEPAGIVFETREVLECRGKWSS